MPATTPLTQTARRDQRAQLRARARLLQHHSTELDAVARTSHCPDRRLVAQLRDRVARTS